MEASFTFSWKKKISENKQVLPWCAWHSEMYGPIIKMNSENIITCVFYILKKKIVG